MAKRKVMTATPVAPAPGEAVVIAREGLEPSPDLPLDSASAPVPDHSKDVTLATIHVPAEAMGPGDELAIDMEIGAGKPKPKPKPKRRKKAAKEPGITVTTVDEWPDVERALSVAVNATIQTPDHGVEPEGRGEESAVPASLPEGAQDQQGSPPKAVAIGRPSIFTDELAATICTRLSSGESLRSICREDGMPHVSTVMGWVFRNSEFFAQYRAAREMQAELMADEMQDIADDGSNDWMERHNSKGQFIGWMENGEAIKRSALRINTRQWIAARLLPKRWGDKSQVTHQNPDGTPVGQPIDPRTLSPEQREALGDALRAAMRQGAVDAEYEAEDAQ